MLVKWQLELTVKCGDYFVEQLRAAAVFNIHCSLSVDELKLSWFRVSSLLVCKLYRWGKTVTETLRITCSFFPVLTARSECFQLRELLGLELMGLSTIITVVVC